jgi:hypothetical protein
MLAILGDGVTARYQSANGHAPIAPSRKEMASETAAAFPQGWFIETAGR